MSTSGLGQYGPLGQVAGIALVVWFGVFLLRRWQLTTASVGDSLRGEYLSRLCGLLSLLSFLAAAVVMFGAELLGMEPPRFVIFGLGYGMVVFAVGAALSGLVSWAERRAAARRDKQLGITDVKPRRLSVGSVMYFWAIVGLFLGSLVATGILVLMTLGDPEFAASVGREQQPPTWLFVVVIVVTAMVAGAAGYWQSQRRK